MWRCILLPQDDLANEDTQAIFQPSSCEPFLDMPLPWGLHQCVHPFHASQGGCHTVLIKSTGMLYFSFSSLCYTFISDTVLHNCHLHVQCLGFHVQGVTHNSVSVYCGFSL